MENIAKALEFAEVTVYGVMLSSVSGEETVWGYSQWSKYW